MNKRVKNELLWLHLSVMLLVILSALDNCHSHQTDDRFTRIFMVGSKQASVARKTHD